MYKIILVPLDGSKRAESILSHVETLARNFKSKVIFFVAIEPVLILEYNEIIGMSEFMEKNDYLKEKTVTYLDSLEKKFSKKGIEVQTTYRPWSGGEGDCRCCRTRKCRPCGDGQSRPHRFVQDILWKHCSRCIATYRSSSAPHSFCW